MKATSIPKRSGLGSRVFLEELESGEDFDYLIVGSAEADPERARISNESPVGRALMGQKAGDTVTVNAPMGNIRYRIKEIKKMA